MSVRVQTEDFDLSQEVKKLHHGDTRVGAVVAFVGLVRDMSGGSTISEMSLEHYPGMTEKSLEAIVAQAGERWELLDVRVIHRVGPLKPADQIVMVAVSSAHRGEAFMACEFIMDYLKTHAPFWKKEVTPQGAHWVDARESDDAATERWGISCPWNT